MIAHHITDALSIRPHWAKLIELGRKTIELRTWRAPARLLGKRVAICTTLAGLDRDVCDDFEIDPMSISLGRAICFVTLAGCRLATAEDSDASCCDLTEEELDAYREQRRPLYAFELADARRILVPFKVRGAPGHFVDLRKIDPNMEEDFEP